MKTKLLLGLGIPMSKDYIFSLLFLILGVGVWGQTTLISPTVNNGGFESNLTGWTTAQTGVGRGAWYSGTATFFAGDRSAYISNDGNTSNAYTGNAERVQHLYRSIAFPAGETIINLSFYWKANGEGSGSNDWDNLKVFVSSTAPTAGTPNLEADRVGLNWYNLQTTWQNASITLPTSLAGTTKYLIFQWKHDGSGTYNPPAAIDNITLTSQAPAVCSGTPSPGNTNASSTSVVSGGTTVLSLQNATTGSGVSYQWQSSTTSASTGFTNISSATSATYTATVTARTWYRCVVTCSGSSGTSNAVQVNLGYCTSVGSTTFNTGIRRVVFNTLDNATPAVKTSGYTHFTSHVTNVAAGSLQSLSVYVNTDGSYTLTTKAWIDWNQNGLFDASETYELGTATGGASVLTSASPLSITVPIGAALGNTRMRITTIFGVSAGTPTVCNASTFDGETEDYTINVLAASPCSGTPNAGTALANGVANAFANVNASITLSASGLTTGSGLSYQWFSSPNGTAWTPISGATTATYAATAVATETTTYYRLVTTCANGGATNTSSNAIVITSLPYCVPSSTTASTYYITDVKFQGINAAQNLANGFSTSPSGYQNWTANPKTAQTQGEPINVSLGANASVHWKAWVDWNKDGLFNATTEQVYSNGSYTGQFSEFGFVIPVSTPPGDYRIRFRVSTSNSTFNSCNNSGNGESEDYLFTVLPNCSATITNVTDGKTCGTGPVNLAVVASGSPSEYRWYVAETGGTPVATTPSGSWTTPSLSATTTYYVTAFNGCESTTRTPIKATISPMPVLNFNNPNPTVCGEASVIELSVSGDRQEVVLFDEKFNGGLGLFENINTDSNNSTFDGLTRWTNKTSTHLPSGALWTPAISSGISGNGFAFATSDIVPDTAPYNIENSLTLTTGVNTTGFLNLTLSLRVFYSRYLNDGNSMYSGTYYQDDLKVEVFNGSTWATLATYDYDLGVGNRFATLSFPLPASYLNITDLKVRVRHYSSSSSSLYFPGGVAVDDIKLYGEKALGTAFGWTSTPSINAYIDAACTITYNPSTDTATTVYFRPSLSQMVNSTFTITANAALSNGCTASDNVTITNNTKLWTGAVSNNWNVAGNWLPNGVPTVANCIVLDDIDASMVHAGTNAFGKNLVVKPASSLTINPTGSLTIVDEILLSDNGTPTNFADDGKLIIENTGSLIQVTNPPVDGSGNSINANLGVIEMKRTTTPMYRYDFTYWSSPIEETPSFTLNTLSPGTLADKYYKWNSATQNWQTVMSGASAMDEGIGYIVRAPQSYAIEGQAGATPTAYTASFFGKPNNGIISVGIVGGSDKWNLLGNPYPSAISANAFINHSANAGLDGTLYFWTHNSRPVDTVTGDAIYNYTSADYAAYNLTGGTATATTGAIAGNNNNAPDGTIPAGQSFFVQGTITGTALFNNAMRVTGPNTNFYRTGQTNSDGRMWLNLSTENGAFHQALVGYVANATNGMDRGYDGVLLGGNAVTLYSLSDSNKLTIQGRQLPFSVTDEVPLGTSFAAAGTYKISIDHFDGFFDDESVYLEDRTSNVFHDLKQSAYTFTSGAGTFDNRFVLRYLNPLSKPDFELLTDEVFVLNRDGKLVVQSSTENLKRVTVYDLVGRNILSKEGIHDKEFVISGILATEQTLLLHIELENGVKVVRKTVVVK